MSRMTGYGAELKSVKTSEDLRGSRYVHTYRTVWLCSFHDPAKYDRGRK